MRASTANFSITACYKIIEQPLQFAEKKFQRSASQAGSAAELQVSIREGHESLIRVQPPR